MERIILHCDCNSFFASVELLDLPHLKDKPVAVCQTDDSRHGIILAKNDLAKACGVQTAEAAWEAKRKCPGLVFVPPHRGLYTKFSNQINTIYLRYTDLVEPSSIDESYLDISGTLHLFNKTAKELADDIRMTVQAETGLTISVGVSFNKVFAKLGSDYKKPNATTEITRENYAGLLYPLPADNMLYVGKAARETLRAAGITTIGAIAAAGPATMEQLLGKAGHMIWLYATGQDTAPVLPAGAGPGVKSIGNGRTFQRDLVSAADLRMAAGALADSVAMRLRSQGLYCTGVQVTMKNPALKSIQRQCPLPPTHLSADLCSAALALIHDNWPKNSPMRMLTITAIGLTRHADEQLSLFEEQQRSPKAEPLEEALYKLRKRFGSHAVAPAGTIKNSLGLRGPTIEEGAAGEEDIWED